MASTPTIRPVLTKADRKAFVDLPFRLYRDDPNWVPPLKTEALGLITPEMNGWFSHAEAQLFLAERDGRVVGRISAHIRSEEHTSELQSLMRISYAVFCLKKKKKHKRDRERT